MNENDVVLIEFLDEKPINNVLSTLYYKPQKIIYIGLVSKNRFQEKHLPILKAFYACKGLNCFEINYQTTNIDNLTDVIQIFETIIEENINQKLIFDLSGGEEILLVALGMIAQK
jgi:hypothetical protein